MYVNKTGEEYAVVMVGNLKLCQTNDWTFTGMAPDNLPRISSKDCAYPFTYIGGLYHGCVENMESTTGICERWGCVEVNYTGAVCAADIGMPPRYRAELTT